MPQEVNENEVSAKSHKRAELKTFQDVLLFCKASNQTLKSLNFSLMKCLNLLLALPEGERAAAVETIIDDGSMTWFVAMVELCLSWAKDDAGEWSGRRFVLGELSLQIAQTGRAYMIDYLVGDFSGDFDMGYTNFEEMPLLSVAALHNNHAVVERLMHHRAETNAVDPKTGYTPLMYAAREGAYESVCALLGDEAVDVSHVSSVDETTALTLSYLQTDIRIVCRIQAALLMSKYASLCDEGLLKSAEACLLNWRELFVDLRDNLDVTREWAQEFFDALPRGIASLGRDVFNEDEGLPNKLMNASLSQGVASSLLFKTTISKGHNGPKATELSGERNLKHT